MTIIVLVCLLPALTESVIALTSLASVNSNVVTLDERSAKPLAVLGDLRDMEGNTRVLVWEYVTAGRADHAALRGEIADTDAQANQDIASYGRQHGSHTDSRAQLMAQFASKLQAYREVRDQQVLALADQGQTARAHAALIGPLDAANKAMAGPIDALFDQDIAAANAAERHGEKSYDRARVAVGIVLLLGLLAAGFAAWQLTGRLVAAIGRIRSVMTSGNRQERVGELHDRGELAELGLAIDGMLDSLAAQDAELRHDQSERDDQMKAAFVRQQLAEQEVRRRAQTVIDDTAQTVVTELQDVVAQAEAVLAAGIVIDERLSDADKVTQAVVDRARDADRVVAAVGESLKRVGGIAKLIAGVAEQTNLLALNATIEAARAGEAGKGFSVVASEVKGLAAQTASSTSEITVTVDNLESDSSAMAQVIAAMAEGVKSIDSATARVSQVAGDQRTSVEKLDLSVRAALGRIKAMSALTDGLERRREERVSITGMVSVRAEGRTWEAHLRDISESGLRCSNEPDHQIGIGTKVQVELSLGGEANWLDAMVVRITPGADDQDLGLEIDQDSPAALAFVRRYMTAMAGLQLTA
jgi:methyl-accepting chemotaxis protein